MYELVNFSTVSGWHCVEVFVSLLAVFVGCCSNIVVVSLQIMCYVGICAVYNVAVCCCL